MSRIAYVEWSPRDEATRAIIAQANDIAVSYARQGYDLTLRQLYYQFVARALIPNTLQSYKRLGDIVNKARLAGLMDWAHIVDRTRNLVSQSHWENPADIINSAAESYHVDLWSDQSVRVEVWVEKEALAGVVARAGQLWDVAHFSCRGYVSQSELWAAGRRLVRYVRHGQRVVILHLGDHDPSGLDMTRDIGARVVDTFAAYELGASRARREIEVRRIALNFDQVQQYSPPPNPAKLTDSRAAGYVDEYGFESWELDALDPATLNGLIDEHVTALVDLDAYRGRQDYRDEGQRLLRTVAARWTEVVDEFGAGDA